MNAFERTEYVALRLVRRFVFSENRANRFSRWLPYYAPSVNEEHSERIVGEYARLLGQAGIVFAGRRVLEVGAGRTNGVGYGLLAEGAAAVYLLEPFVAFDPVRDEAIRSTARRIDFSKTRRVQNFAAIESASIDLLLSNSVLEHVHDLHGFFADCRRVLAPGGVMLHKVDYRDHFFKYPYAFLTFSDATWSRWLDPGDLPRWRLGDHLRELAAAGCNVEVLEQQSAPELFEQIKPQLAARFTIEEPGIDVTGAALLSRHS